MNIVLFAILLMPQHQLGKGYWTKPGFVSSIGAPEWEYHAHSSVCGVVHEESIMITTYPGHSESYYVFDTLKSGGAKKGLSGRVATLDEAKAVVEEDCK